jgi:hypothetical protein
MTENLRGVITTDLPATYAAPETESPLAELEDEEFGKKDIWMFGPLIAAAVALPIIATALLGFSVYHLASKEAALSSPPPATFAARWQAQEAQTSLE